jgi:hypothetical protein
MNSKKLAIAALAAWGLCGAAGAGQGPCAAPCCGDHCAAGIPCVPGRVTFGYFPTTWRRWPTELEELPAQEAPEPLPAPGETKPGAPAEPGAPKAPTEPEKGPLEPPFGAQPQAPPGEEPPLAPPFETPGQVPPALPESKEPAPFDPTVPPQTAPSADMPAPATEEPLPPPDKDLPPTMPEDDPFKDDPETEVGPPPAETPKPEESPKAEESPKPVAESAPDQSARQETLRWQVASEGGAELMPGMPADGRHEPRRLQTPGEQAAPAPLPAGAMRENPLRTTKPGGFRRAIVPTAAVRERFSDASAATASGTTAVWRANPLRSN